jgi:hypothetical protein
LAVFLWMRWDMVQHARISVRILMMLSFDEVRYQEKHAVSSKAQDGRCIARVCYDEHIVHTSDCCGRNAVYHVDTA